jgi:hypothetical protein
VIIRGYGGVALIIYAIEEVVVVAGLANYARLLDGV